jgi:succinate dehydrogenase/fumarate reductase cytochrome b subunit
MKLRKLHRLSAGVIATYALVHIANHLVALNGVASHIAFMEVARAVYRAGAVEWVLLAAVVVQIATGLATVLRGWRERRGWVPWLQAGSGAYLAFFLLNHVGAVLYGRTLGLDTNFYYAAAGLHVPPFQFFFAPYYFLAVLALFTHLGCALYWQVQSGSSTARRLAVAVPTTVGAVLSLMIVLAMAGVFYPVDIPENYKATFAFQ